jgi:hypothetical protein
MLFKKAYHPLPAVSRPFFLNLPPTATSLPVLADVSAGLLTLHPSGAVPAPTDAFGRNTVTHLPSEPPRPAIRLELTAHRGHGGLWDAFSARLSSSHNASLIIKLVNISSFPLTANELDFSRNILSEFEARRDVLRELKVYSSEEGSRLQGSVIPEFLGLVGSLQDGGEVWVAILEDAGDALKDGEKWVPGVR